MLVLGKHDSGCVSTLEVIGGSSTSFLLEVTGDHGSLKITGGRGGGYQVGALKLEASFDAGPAPLPLLPELGTAPAANVAEAYSRLGADIRSGRHTVPDFQLAVRLTRLLDRIDLASSSGMRQKLE
jgi:predicted dehydrogenase